MRIFLFSIIAALALAASAQASELTGSFSPVLQSDMNAYLVPTPNRAIPVFDDSDPSNPCHEGSCEDRGSIWLEGASEPDEIALYEFAHEVGHVFDVTNFSNADRQAFRRIIGAEGVAWWHGDSPPGEKFAMAYSYCARAGSLVHAEREFPGYDYEPTRRQHHEACALIRQARH